MRILSHNLYGLSILVGSLFTYVYTHSFNSNVFTLLLQQVLVFWV